MGGRRLAALIAFALAAVVLALTWHTPTVPRIGVDAPDGLVASARAVRAGFGNFTVAVTIGNTGEAARSGRAECVARTRFGLELGRGAASFGPLAPQATALADVTVTGTSGRSARYVDCALT